VSGDWGRREERRRGAASAVQRGGGGGVFYRAGEAVEFYSLSVSKELKGEEEMGRR
jgi:hypothetical protein